MKTASSPHVMIRRETWAMAVDPLTASQTVLTHNLTSLMVRLNTTKRTVIAKLCGLCGACATNMQLIQVLEVMSSCPIQPMAQKKTSTLTGSMTPQSIVISRCDVMCSGYFDPHVSR